MFIARKQETVLEAQTRALNVPRYRYQAEALDLKLWIEHVRRDQTRNGFRGTNSCFKCTPILIFAAGLVRQQNSAKPSKT